MLIEILLTGDPLYLLVDLKNMGWNIYKTSSYNRNLRVLTFGWFRAFITCFFVDTNGLDIRTKVKHLIDGSNKYYKESQSGWQFGHLRQTHTGTKAMA